MPAISTANDAIDILKADHARVTELFKEFERLHQDESDAEAESVAHEICNELTIHARVEEEIFYPELREAIDDEDLIDEAEVEHATAKDLIADISGMTCADEKFAAKVTVLGEYIAHHVKEEHEEMFPMARKTRLDMGKLGARILERKKELQAEMQPEDEAAS